MRSQSVGIWGGGCDAPLFHFSREEERVRRVCHEGAPVNFVVAVALSMCVAPTTLVSCRREQADKASIWEAGGGRLAIAIETRSEGNYSTSAFHSSVRSMSDVE